MAELAEQLATQLREAGYNGAAVTSSSLQWATNLESGRALLRAICQSGCLSQALEDEELKAYKKLKKEGRVVRGSELQRRLKAAMAEEEEDSEADRQLAAEVAALRAQRDRLQASLARKRSQNEVVREVQASLEAQMSGFAVEEEADGADGAILPPDAMALNTDLNTAIAKVVATAQAAVASLQAAVESDEETAAVTAQHLEGEAAYSAAVKALAQQMHSASMADSKVVVTPEAARQRRAEAYERNARELDRLVSVYALSERRAVESCARLAGALAKLEALRKQVAEAGVALPSEAVAKQQAAVHRTQERHNRMQLEELLDAALPSVLQRLAGVQAVSVLSADYGQKMARQAKRLRLHEHVIELLVQQRARQEVLLMMKEAEEATILHAAALLRLLLDDLEGQASATVLRTQRLQDVQRERELYRQEEAVAVPETDSFLRSIYELISLGGVDHVAGGPAVLPEELLLHRASQLKQKLDEDSDAVKKQQMVLVEEMAGVCARLKQTVQLLKQMEGKEPDSPIKAFNDLYGEVKVSLKTLSSRLEQLLKSKAEKEQQARRSRSGERDLFRLFFAAPDELLKAEKALEARVRAAKM